MNDNVVLELPGDVKVIVQVRGEQTNEAFALISDVTPPGWALPAHRHDVSETIYVTAGRMWIDVDGWQAELAAGDSVHVAPGVRHRGGTAGDIPLERVLVFAPAGMEHLFEALATVAEPAEMLRLARDYGWRFD